MSPHTGTDRTAALCATPDHRPPLDAARIAAHVRTLIGEHGDQAVCDATSTLNELSRIARHVTG